MSTPNPPVCTCGSTEFEFYSTGKVVGVKCSKCGTEPVEPSIRNPIDERSWAAEKLHDAQRQKMTEEEFAQLVQKYAGPGNRIWVDSGMDLKLKLYLGNQFTVYLTRSTGTSAEATVYTRVSLRGIEKAPESLARFIYDTLNQIASKKKSPPPADPVPVDIYRM